MLTRTMKKSLLIVICLVLVAAAVFGLWYVVSGRASRLADPRALVPADASVYIEIASYTRLDGCVQDASGMTGMKTTLGERLGQGEELANRMVKEPNVYGLDLKRPIGIFMVFNPARNAQCLLLPVDGAGKLAKQLSKSERDLGAAAQQVGQQFVALKKGYLIVAGQKETVESVLNAKGPGFAVKAPAGSPLVFACLSDSVFRQLAQNLEAARMMMPPAAQAGVSVANRALASVRDVVLTFDWDAAGGRLRLKMGVDEKNNLILPAFLDANGQPPLLAQLPPASAVGGIRVNTEKAQAAARAIIDELASAMNDSALLDLFEASRQTVSRENGLAIFNFSQVQSELTSLALKTIPAGLADSYLAINQRAEEKSLQISSAMIAGAPGKGPRFTVENLPAARYRDIAVQARAITTILKLDLPAELPPELVKKYKELERQRVVTRYAVFTGNAAGATGRLVADYFVTAVGADPAIMNAEIDLLAGGQGSAAEAPGYRELVKFAGGDIFAYFFFDPLVFNPFAQLAQTGVPERSLGVVARCDASSLTVEVLLPRANLQALIRALVPPQPAPMPMQLQ